MVEAVLVPTDGSESARRSEGYAADVARAYGASVHVVHVVDLVALGSVAEIDPAKREGHELVEAAAERVAARGVRVVRAVRTGVPAPVIREYVAEASIDLIVMGTRGQSGLERRLLGGVTKGVVRSASVPVMTVGPGADRPAHYPYRRLLVATDGSDAALGAAEVGIDFARTYEAGLDVLSVVHGRRSSGAIERIAAARDAVTEVERLAAEAGIEDVSPVIEYGIPHRTITASADRNGIDLVVLGAYGRTGIRRHVLGSVAERVVRTAPVPVLTVRPRQDS
ncbi:universal stress protein [Halalkalicoccus jeotgali]|uniref:UspA domain protein n=1 Tax=Halalkalicoccus jeotgali (strain DSM 18796 / CECT 7217 / JCM 14584 / KCTC 4019 / B3) TaxID=795797 RepID=D8J430_HALJB|nr:universal stress protein [Halalkalicoccus jeotgali]ADJ15422.1 UspA domain protein [Halalkalicoccus jeotgali B3]ELY35802.1 UspA domain-containing protein [Halalkalicoccus jeotgali B3]